MMLTDARQGAGQPRRKVFRRGKSGLHETRVAGNARRVWGLAPGFRESATESKPPIWYFPFRDGGQRQG